MIDTLVKSGNVVTSTGSFKADIAIDGEKIVTIGAEGTLPRAEKEIDAHGKYVLPGMMDPHNHFYGNNFEELTRAAAFGGITTVIPFARGDVKEDCLEILKRLRDEGVYSSWIDFGLHLYVFNVPGALENIPRVVKEGVNTMKMFLAYKKRGMMSTDDFILQVMSVMKEQFKGIIQVHAEEGDLNDYLQDKFIAEGRVSPQDFPLSQPNVSEAMAIERILYLAELSQCPLYVVHLTTHQGLEAIEGAQKRGVKVWTEACPQYLTLTDDEIERQGPLVKFAPPLRKKEDAEALWGGLARGSIAVVSSDHCSYSRESKNPGWENIFKAPDGTTVIETMVPLMYTEGVVKRGLGIGWLAKVMSENPARIYGLFPKKGVIQVGSDADLTILDPDKEVVISAKNLHYTSDYTPWEGWKVKGWPVMTLVRGHVLLNGDRLEQKPGFGQFISRPIK